MNKQKIIDSFTELSSGISELAFPGVGAAFGTALGGPDGAATGAILGESLKSVALDMISRHLSKNERDRVDIVSEFAISKINYRNQQGNTIINEAFLDFENEDAAELFEGVLLKAKSSYESKKLFYLSNIFANAPFLNLIIEDINLILKLIDELTYEQLLLIYIIKQTSIKFNPKATVNDKAESKNIRSLYFNLIGLQTKGLIYDKDNEGDIGITGQSEINISSLSLTTLGQMLFDLTELNEVSSSDLEKIKDKIKEITPIA